jgi:hypothetical protein
MALFRVSTYKRLNALNGEKWVNTYYFEALGESTALDSGELAAGYEMACSPSDVEVYRITAKLMPAGDTAQRAVAIPGELTIDPVNLIPFFNTIRVVLTDDVGRSESKYLRGMLGEANVNGWNITDAKKTAMQDDYLTPLLAILGLRGPNGEVIAGGSVQSLIQMRQLGWHRRERVGYHRGWVPD